MGWVQEFREFAIKGNVVDLAVGVVIGAAFGKIVSSLVGDVIMPLIGLVTSGGHFSGLKFVMVEAQGSAPEVAIAYGNFLQTIVDFLIIAWAIFIVVKLINRLKKNPPPAEAPAPTQEVLLLTQIRDLLKK